VDGGHREQAGPAAAPDQQRLVGEGLEVAVGDGGETSESAVVTGLIAPDRAAAERQLRR
jgi:hypothetical protein